MTSEDRLKIVMASVLDCTPTELSEQMSRETFPGWDSLRHMNLILALEEEFDVTISDDEADEMTSYVAVRRVVATQVDSRQ